MNTETLERTHQAIESRQRKDLIVTVLLNSAHANLSIATCGLLANAIHAAAVGPLEDENARLKQHVKDLDSDLNTACQREPDGLSEREALGEI